MMSPPLVRVWWSPPSTPSWCSGSAPSAPPCSSTECMYIVQCTLYNMYIVQYVRHCVFAPISNQDIFRYIWAVTNLCLRIYYQKKLIADPVIRTSIKKDYINKFWLKVLPKNCSIYDQTLKDRITKPFNLCFVIKPSE